MNLRSYRSEDAAVIVSWVKDEAALRRWTSDRFADTPYPLPPERFDRYYQDPSQHYFPCSAEENGRLAGHILLRWTDEETRTLRLGFVIVDDARRGEGLGRRMVEAACRRGYAEMDARRITLGVFENNPAALRCYTAAGFRPCGEKVQPIGGERWRCIEMELTPEQYARHLNDE
jgi:RimJ/RimL family protein N-acetyltransferase